MLTLLRQSLRLPSLSHTMATVAAPQFKPFKLALIQLGNIGSDKSTNLRHAREQLLKAANGEGSTIGKPDLIVLPVRIGNNQILCLS